VKRRLIVAAVLVAAAGVAAWAFASALTPYVPFEAAASSGRHVQIIGQLVADSVGHDVALGALLMTLRSPDTGALMNVALTGAVPQNIHHATEVVAMGRYQDGVFWARRVLVKCPSRYDRGG